MRTTEKNKFTGGSFIIENDHKVSIFTPEDFNEEQLIKNYNAILDTLEKEKSNITIKGDLIKSAFITSTMGVSYKLKLNKIF